MLKTSWKDHVQLFLGLHYQKKGQIYFDPKAHWDKTALKSSPKNHAKISSKKSMEKILGKLSRNPLKNPQVKYHKVQS